MYLFVVIFVSVKYKIPTPFFSSNPKLGAMALSLETFLQGLSFEGPEIASLNGTLDVSHHSTRSGVRGSNRRPSWFFLIIFNLSFEQSMSFLIISTMPSIIYSENRNRLIFALFDSKKLCPNSFSLALYSNIVYCFWAARMLAQLFLCGAKFSNIKPFYVFVFYLFSFRFWRQN